MKAHLAEVNSPANLWNGQMSMAQHKLKVRSFERIKSLSRIQEADKKHSK